MLLNAVFSFNADSPCLSAMPRQPAHSREVYTDIDFIADKVHQLFLCDVGYTAANDGGYQVYTSCNRGVWTPEQTIDCIASEYFRLNFLFTILFTVY